VVYLHEFCTPSLDGSQWSAPHPGYCAWEKNYQQPLNRWLGGPQTQHGHFEEDTNLLPLLTVNPWIIQPTVQSLTQTICRSSSPRHYKRYLVLWYCGQQIDGLSDWNSLLRELFENLASYHVKVLENNTMCIWLYVYSNHMFAYWSIYECCFTVVWHEYYGLPSCGGHVASI
jgi:hypothetical protein